MHLPNILQSNRNRALACVNYLIITVYVRTCKKINKQVKDMIKHATTPV